ncbi:MAG: DUF4058 family protein [Chloroflexaceae bacterium]
MPAPFPGMDPYLEHPDLWPEVHHRLITAIADALAPQVRPKYRVAIEKRTYLLDAEDLVWVGVPDVTVGVGKAAPEVLPHTPPAPQHQPLTVTVPMPEEVRESFLEIREIATGEVVTVLELLSPGNKRAGEGRRVYELKRRHVLSSLTHLVEVDLLRAGEALPLTGDTVQADYRILVSRSDERPRAQLYAFQLRDAIPVFPLPLPAGDAQPQVDIQTLLGEVYDRAGFDLVLDYGREPVPALHPENQAWADALLREKGLRA